MKKIEQYRTTIRIVSVTIFNLIATAIYFFVWDTVYNPDFVHPYLGRGRFFIALVYFAILFFITVVLGSYRIDELRRGEVVFYQVIALVFVNTIAYTQICLVETVLSNVIGILFVFLLQLLELLIWLKLSYTVVTKLNPAEKLLIIYGSHLATEIVQNMSRMEERYVIAESASVDEGYDILTDKIDKYDSVIICDVPARLRNDILKYCYQQNKTIYTVPKISDVIIRGAKEITYFDTPIIKSSSMGLTVEQRVVKRIFDVVLSLLALIVLSPVFLVVALAIKLYDRGPVFYKQKRCTRDLEMFDILKFRSMVVDAEKNGPQPAVDNDSRITPVGRVIRALRIDELPQIINILVGQMSIVGPRPERQVFIDKIMEVAPYYVHVYKMRPGLTSKATLYNGYTDTMEKMVNRLDMDLEYLTTRSLWVDIKIIFKTAVPIADTTKTNINAKSIDEYIILSQLN